VGFHTNFGLFSSIYDGPDVAETVARPAFYGIKLTATKSGKKLVYTSSKQESEGDLSVFAGRHQ